MAVAAKYMIVLGADVAQAQRGIQQVHEQARGLGEYVRQGFGIGAGVAAFQSGLQLLGGALGAAKSAMVDFNSDLQKAQISFEAMLGSAQKAQAYLAQLQQFAAKTPFEFPELMAAARKLMNVGVAAESVIPLLTRVGDAVAMMGGSKDEIAGVSRALAQMISSGRVQAEEMEQLAERSIPAWRILADYLGKTEGQVRDMTRAGQVSAAQFIAAFDQFYSKAENGAGAMDKMSRTWEGALSTIRDNLRMFGATAFEPIFTRLTALANKIAEALQSEQFQRFAGFVQGLFEMAGQAIDAFAQKLAPLGAALGTAFEALTRGDFSGFAQGLSSAAAEGLNGLLAMVKDFGQQLFGAGAELVGELVNGITSTVGGAFNQATTAVASLMAGLIGGGGGETTQAAQAAGTEVGQAVAAGVAAQAPAAAAAGAAIANAVKTGLSLDQIPMDLQGVKDLVAGASDNMATLDAAGQRVKETVRGISAEMLSLQLAIAPIRMQLDDVKRSYDDQIQAVRDQIDAVTARHSVGLEEQRLVADLAVLEAQRTLEIARGDQAVRMRLDAEIQELQIQQRALALEHQRASLAELRANPPGSRSPAEQALEDFKRQSQLQDWADREAEISRRQQKSKKKQDDQDDDREYKAQQERVRRQREEQQAKDKRLQEQIRQLTEQEAAIRAKYREIDMAEEKAASERKRQLREQEFRDRLQEIADELSELDIQQRRVSRMGGRGMYDALKAIEKQRKNLLKQQQKMVDGREEEKKQEEEQARKAERKRLMEAELALLDAQKKALEEQRRQNREIISDLSAGIRKRTQAAKEFEAYDATTARARLEREKQLAALQAAVDAERLARAQAEWERRVKAAELALQIAEKEAERERLGDAAAIRRAEQALAAANARKRELDLLWQIEEAENRIAAQPLLDRLRELERARRDEVRALEDQLRPLERQLALLGLQKQQWEAIAGQIKEMTDKLKEAAKATKEVMNLGKLEIDLSAVEEMKKKLAEGQEAAKRFVEGFGKWLRENFVALAFGGIGALIGGALFGPIGAIAGAIFGFLFGKAVQDKLREWGIDPAGILPKLQEWATEMARLILPRLSKAFDEVKAAVEFLWPYLEKVGRWLWDNRETIATMVEWWIKLRVAVWGVQLVFGLLATVIGIILSPFTALLGMLGPLAGFFKAIGSGASLLLKALTKLGPALRAVLGWFLRLGPLLARIVPLLPLIGQGFLRLLGLFAGPVGWIILGLITLIGALWAAWENWDTIKPYLDQAGNWISEKLGWIRDTVSGWFSGWEAPDFSNWFSGFQFPDLTGFLDPLRNLDLSQYIPDWSSLFANFPSFDLTQYLPTWESITAAFWTLYENVTGGFTATWDRIVEKTIADAGIRPLLGNMADQMEEQGNNVLAGLLRGLQSIPIIGGLINGIATVATMIIDRFKQMFGIASPSTVMEGFGINILEGLLNGLNVGVQAVIDWFAELPKKMMDAFNAAMAAVGGWGANLVASIKAALDAAYNGVITSASNLGTNIANMVASGFSLIQAKAQQIGQQIADGLSAAWATAGSWASWLAGQLSNTINAAWTSIRNGAAAVGSYIATGLSEAWTACQSWVTWLRDQITTPFAAAFASFRTMAASIGSQIANGFSDAWATIGPWLTWLRDQMIASAQAAITALKTKLGEIATSISDAIYNSYTTISAAATWLITSVGTLLMGLATKAVEAGNAFKDKLIAAWNDVTATATAVLNGMLATVTNVMTAITSTVYNKVQELRDTFTGYWTSATQAAQNALNSIGTAITNAMTYARDTLVGLASQVSSAISNAISQMLSGITNGAYSLYSAVTSKVQEIATWLYQQGTAMWQAAKTVGESIANGLTAGINAAMQTAINAASAGVTAVMNVIRQILQMGSPSKVTTYYGEMIGAGLTRGIENSMDEAKRAAGELFALPQVSAADAGMVASAGAGGGSGGPAVVNVYVVVEGSVQTELDLVESVRQGMIAVSERNGTPGLSRVPGL